MLPGPSWPRPSAPPQRSLNGVVLHIKQNGSDQAYDLTYNRECFAAIDIGRSPNQSSINEFKRIPNHGGKAMFRCPVVSRRHAKITLTADGSAYIIDLGSHHGTYLQKYYNQLPSKISSTDPTRLDNGDTLTFGKTVGRDQKEVIPVTAKVELLPSGNIHPFFTPPIGYNPPNGIKLSPSSSSGRYGLKEDAASASSSDSDDQLHSDLDDSPRPLDRKTTPCFTPVDWKSVFSSAAGGSILEGTSEGISKDSSAPELADALSDGADVTRDQESDEGSDVESQVHASFPGSFPASLPSLSLRQSFAASYAGAQPLEQSYQGGSFLYDDDEDMHLETPPPEDLIHCPSPLSNDKDLSIIQSELNKVKDDVRSIGLLRALVTANHRASTSRYIDLGARVGSIQTDTSKTLERLEEADIPDIQRRLEKAQSTASDALTKTEELSETKDALRRVREDVSDVYSQLDELREMIEGVRREREDDEMVWNEELQAGIHTMKGLIRDLHKEQELVDKKMEDLNTLRAQFDTDVSMQLVNIDDARQSALLEIEEASREAQKTLKRKRSIVFENADSQQNQTGGMTLASQTSSATEEENSPQGTQQRSFKRKRLISTASAVTVGAVATWSALAFS